LTAGTNDSRVTKKYKGAGRPSATDRIGITSASVGKGDVILFDRF